MERDKRRISVLTIVQCIEARVKFDVCVCVCVCWCMSLLLVWWVYRLSMAIVMIGVINLYLINASCLTMQ